MIKGVKGIEELKKLNEIFLGMRTNEIDLLIDLKEYFEVVESGQVKENEIKYTIFSETEIKEIDITFKIENVRKTEEFIIKGIEAVSKEIL